jgi:A/G-specific adenine glycosylase
MARPAGTLDGVSTPSSARLHRLRKGLLAWYDREHRDFPWRSTRDPYAVLVSEVMLQQTQASRVTERFSRFLSRFPTAASLATAPGGAVLEEWSGLGYNRRALSLRAAAAAVTRDGWPDDVAGLEQLPGVGPYTARAIASLAFGRPVGVVDTNVRRWLLRRFGGADAPRALQELADALAVAGDDGRSADWTHATMEFGAAICRSRAPLCDACPVADGCPSRGRAAVVPVPRQEPLRGSDRAYRGAVVRLLSARVDHAMPVRALRARLSGDVRALGPALDDARWRRIVAALERDGLIHLIGGEVRLGAATIDP